MIGHQVTYGKNNYSARWNNYSDSLKKNRPPSPREVARVSLQLQPRLELVEGAEPRQGMEAGAVRIALYARLLP